MGPVREENEEKDEGVPKVLCQMDNHLGKSEQIVQYRRAPDVVSIQL